MQLVYAQHVHQHTVSLIACDTTPPCSQDKVASAVLPMPQHHCAVRTEHSTVQGIM